MLQNSFNTDFSLPIFNIHIFFCLKYAFNASKLIWICLFRWRAWGSGLPRIGLGYGGGGVHCLGRRKSSLLTFVILQVGLFYVETRLTLGVGLVVISLFVLYTSCFSLDVSPVVTPLGLCSSN